MGGEDSGLSLAELTEAAGVSVRTVRYYIAEGLLPPPEGAGPGTSYGQGHLDRLRLIQRMKAAYLPLREIRRRLAGMDDAAVNARLAQGAREDIEHGWDRDLSAARDYLALMEAGVSYQAPQLPLRFQQSAPPADDQAAGTSVEEHPDAAARATAVPIASRRAPDPGDATAPLWRHIPLGDEAELVISERAYARYRDRVDWLVRWARKVFG